MHKPRVWVIPGMGSDSRIFRKLKFPWPATFLEWIPTQPDDTIESYSERLLGQLPIASEDLLFGYSLGGIIAQDWASRHQVQRVIILSSLHHTVQIRPLFRRLARTGMLDWSSPEGIRHLIFFMARLNSTPSRVLDLYLEMMEQFPPEHYTWTLKHVLSWDHPTPLCPVHSFRGTLDLVFPDAPKDISRHHDLRLATHLSLITHSAEISAYLKDTIDPTLSNA